MVALPGKVPLKKAYRHDFRIAMIRGSKETRRDEDGNDGSQIKNLGSYTGVERKLSRDV
jgi:hypothetical protein